jgi:hypothetical protein
MLRGLCLEKLEAAKQELTAGLELDAQASSPDCKAEPSLLVDVHSALAIIAARTAFSILQTAAAAAAAAAAQRLAATPHHLQVAHGLDPKLQLHSQSQQMLQTQQQQTVPALRLSHTCCRGSYGLSCCSRLCRATGWPSRQQRPMQRSCVTR